MNRGDWRWCLPFPVQIESDKGVRGLVYQIPPSNLGLHTLDFQAMSALEQVNGGFARRLTGGARRHA